MAMPQFEDGQVLFAADLNALYREHGSILLHVHQRRLTNAHR